MSAFFHQFSETLKHADKRPDENSVSTERVPLTLPEIPKPFPQWPADSKLGTTATVQLKSIKVPKFTLEYDVPLKESVYSLKERLLTDANCPLAEGLSPICLKLLLKTKVIADTRQLAELPSLAFTVMTMSTAEQIDVPLSQIWNTPVETPKIETKKELPGINAQFWREVTSVARRYVAEPEEFVNTLKQAHDLD